MKKTKNYFFIFFLILLGTFQLFGQINPGGDSSVVKKVYTKPLHREIEVRRNTRFTMGIGTASSVGVSYDWKYKDEQNWSPLGASFMLLKTKLSTFEDSKILYDKGEQYLWKAVRISLPVYAGAFVAGAVLLFTHKSSAIGNDGITPYKIGIATCVGVFVGGVVSQKIFKNKAEKCFYQSVEAYNTHIRLINETK